LPDITKRRLGKTDLEITPIGLGAMEFSGGKGPFKYLLAAVPYETQDEVIKVALESGMNWIDTAEIYGSGESERAVARGLKAAGKSPGEVMITTKWMPVAKRAKSMRKAAAKSTHRLDPYPIDLYLVHRPESLSSVDTQMDEMAKLVDAGTIRAVGISNFSANKMIKAYRNQWCAGSCKGSWYHNHRLHSVRSRSFDRSPSQKPRIAQRDASIQTVPRGETDEEDSTSHRCSRRHCSRA
jgi:aryl-alcohol dehydrogenase-like predicted oxidoreductase